ncbi:MAG: XdhC family protein [Crocinitomicaceae bacterium]|nr:XdhC family protein [Crocinitomicaceae bacterium]
MNFWKNLLLSLEARKLLCLLYVVDSEGSSPGRRGFRQFVTEDGVMYGSIGGGFMEQKLVELAKSLLEKNETLPFLSKQIHRTNISKNKSGMICSGEQTVAFYFLDQSSVPMIQTIVEMTRLETDSVLELSHQGIALRPGLKIEEPFQFSHENEESWLYSEQLNFRNTLYLIGAGHVGLALSRTMSQIGFRVELFDDRDGLNTLVANHYAASRTIVSYDEIEKYVPEGDNVYIVLVTFGFRTDEAVLKKLIGRNYKYLGMLGSEEKVKKIFENLRQEGFTQSLLDRVFSPVGIQIFSQTPEEIAISVAAEIIREKNRPINERIESER